MKLDLICEVCGKNEILTSEEAYQTGWDYPTSMGEYGVVGPRKCNNCSITDTLWWELEACKKPIEQLNKKQKETLKRILNEPKNIIVEE